MSEINFRDYIPDEKRDPTVTARVHTIQRMTGERPQGLFANWRRLFSEPFQGITTSGKPIDSLFKLQSEGAPTKAVVDTLAALLEALTPGQKAAMHFPIDSDQWRNWQNTELFVETHGLRLDEHPIEVRKAVMAVVRASLSNYGFEISRNVMRLNGFLGELIGAPLVLGEWTYTFCLFGEPSLDKPWGWQLFGHHLCLNCFLLGDQMVLTPAFMGAEPSYGDEGGHAGIRLFQDEERSGLALMRGLTSEQQATATVAHSMMGGDLPNGRRHFADNLHLGGAFQDNRIIPYEGLSANTLGKSQRRRLLNLIEAYYAMLPDGPRETRMAEIEQHLAETHFCWIGATEENSTFYYRIQSPVTFIEFDHHTGVFLSNDEPAKFHVHTIVRTPNGNDYGIDLLKLHYQHSKHHRNHK
ncbi:MAG: DUF3500 domain-containing protein [Pseudomonadota bacterium]|nr:DUF3500 domain-containing protein [Pseudomonadota bacterium]